MRILFGVAALLFLALGALCTPTTAWPPPSVQAETVPPPPTPPWQITSTATNIATFVLNATGTELKETYFMQDPACAAPLSATVLISNARVAFTNTMTGQRMAFTLNAGGTIAESSAWTQNFFYWAVHLGDFTGKALLTPCHGQVIFAGESIWMGHGVRPYPRTAVPSSALLHLPTRVTLPPTLITLTNAPPVTDTVAVAWSTIADLNLLHDLAQHPINGVALLYRPATGYLDQAQELAQAEWILIVYTVPLPRTRTRFEHYLPLVRQ